MSGKTDLLTMIDNKVARGTFSINLCGIRSFWMDTLGSEWKIFDLAKPRYDKKLPVVLSRDEVWRILDEVTIPVYRVCLTTIYSCGLRLLEGATLEIPQIDSDLMQLHIHGKGGRDRYVPLPEGTLLMLRSFWRIHRSPIWLLPASTRKGLKRSLATDAGPIHRSSLQRFGDRMLPSHKRVLRNIVSCRTGALGGQMWLCLRCEDEYSVYHSCRDRHCPKCQGREAERWLEKQRALLLPCGYGLATVTLPAGLREIQSILGHVRPETTARYAHLTAVTRANSVDMLRLMFRSFSIRWEDDQ